MEFASWISGWKNPSTNKEVEVLTFKTKTKRSLLKETLAKDKDDITSMDSEDLKMMMTLNMNSYSTALNEITELKIELETFKIKHEELLDAEQRMSIDTELSLCQESLNKIKETHTNILSEAKERNVRIFQSSDEEPRSIEEWEVPPKFNGGIFPNFYEWKFEVEIFFKKNFIQIEEQGRYLMKFTEGPAKKVLKDENSDLYPDAKSILEILKSKFGGKYHIYMCIKNRHTHYGEIPNQIENLSRALEQTRKHLQLYSSAKFANCIHDPEDYARVLIACLPRDERKQVYREMDSTMTCEAQLNFIEENLRSLKKALVDEIFIGGGQGDEETSLEDEIFQSDEEEVKIKPRFQLMKVNCALCKDEEPSSHAVGLGPKRKKRRSVVPETCKNLRFLCIADKLHYTQNVKRVCVDCISSHKSICTFLSTYPYFKCKALDCTLRFSMCPDHVALNKEKLEKTKEQFEELGLDYCIKAY